VRDIPRAAIALAKEFEGLHLVPYRDPIGLWTVGYGHLVTRDRSAPRPPAITLEEADRLLALDLARAARAVRRLCPGALSEDREAALIDFAFNCGAGNLELSTLRRRVNDGDFAGAAEQFARWVYAGGIKLPGLVRRRRAERALFTGCRGGAVGL
jgi:lysozyme